MIKYRIIAEGSYGTIYDLENGKSVIKVIKDFESGITELALLAQLRGCKNIINMNNYKILGHQIQICLPLFDQNLDEGVFRISLLLL